MGLLVNNAGYGSGGALNKIPWDELALTLHLNIFAVVRLTHHFLPALIQRKKGGILFVASTSGHSPIPFLSVYSATKSFVLSLGESLASELSSKGIDVLVFSPGSDSSCCVRHG